MDAVWQTLAAAQAGLDVRRQEHVEALKELDEHEKQLNEQLLAADDDQDPEAAQRAQGQLQQAKRLRNQIMQDLGPDPGRYGVQPEETLDPPDGRQSGTTRTIDPAG